MPREFGITFALTAALKGGFKSAFQSAASQARNVTSAIREMEKSPVGALGASMARQREKIKGLSGSLKEAQASLAALKARADASGNASGMLARQIELAERKVQGLSGALQRQIGQWRNTTAEAANAGGSVRRLSQDYEKLAQRMERAKRVQGALNANRAQGDALRSQRGELGGQLAATMAASAAVAMPAKMAIDFESAIARVGAVSNASAEDMKKLTATARQLGRDTTFSASQAAEGMQYLAMAGFSTEQTISAMPGMLDLAAAANLDLGRTADIASDILTAFGLKATDMGDVADTLAKTFTTSNTDLSMLGDTMKYVAPVAASLGMTLQDTAAYAGAMANAGIKGSQGGTVLRAAMLRIASPPKASRDALSKLTGLEGEELEQLQGELGESAQMLEELGMSTKDADGNLRPMVDILEELNLRTANMGNAEKTEVFKKVFGTEASAGMLSLAEQAAKTKDDKGQQIIDSAGNVTNALRAQIDKVNQFKGVAHDVAEKQNATTRGELKRMASAWEDVGISVGNLFLPAIQAASKAMTTIANVISSFVEKFPNLSKGLALGVGGILALAAGGLTLSLVINFVKTGLNKWQGALLRLTASQVTTAAGTGVMSGAAGVFGVASHAAGAGARFFAGGLRSILTATGIGAILVGLGLAINLLIENWDAVVAAMGRAWAWVTDTWSRLCIFFTELGANLATVFEGFFTPIEEAAAWAWDGIVAIWEGIVEFFGGLWDGVASGAAALWEEVTGLASAAVEWLEGLWNGVCEFFGGIWDWIGSSSGGVWSSIVDFASWAVDGIMSVWEGVAGFFSGIVDTIWGIFTGFFDWLKEKFSWIIDVIEWITGKVEETTGAVNDAYQKSFGEKAPPPGAANAQKAGGKSGAAQNANKAMDKPMPQAREPAKFQPVSRKEAEAASAKRLGTSDSGSKKGGSGKKGGGGGRRSGGGGGGGRSSGSSRGSSESGPVTVVTFGGDNSKPQTLYFPAGSSAATNASSAMSGSGGAAQVASSPAKALPQAPAMVSKGSQAKKPQSNQPISIDLTQNFDLISEDAAAARKVLEALKPDMEKLVRRALESISSDRRRTAYAQ